MKREILLYPNPTLREVSKPFSLNPAQQEGDWTDNPQGLVDDLIETMNAFGGAGLSAIQVGVPLRIFVARAAAEGKDLVFINPTWRGLLTEEGVETKATVKEGCLSFPAFFTEAKRWTHVEATYQDLNGIEYVQTFEGVLAQVIQHECEHLDGVLMSDNLNFTQTNKLKTHMKQYNRRPQETTLKGYGLDPRQFKAMQRQTGARRTS